MSVKGIKKRDVGPVMILVLIEARTGQSWLALLIKNNKQVVSTVAKRPASNRLERNEQATLERCERIATFMPLIIKFYLRTLLSSIGTLLTVVDLWYS